MNERIKELYNKVFAESMNMRWNIEDAEKFAELIVRECGNVAWKCGSEFINNQIKNHFGLKNERTNTST